MLHLVSSAVDMRKICSLINYFKKKNPLNFEQCECFIFNTIYDQ